MHTRSFVAAAALLAALALPVGAQTVALDSHRTLGTPRTFRNLTLIPVYDSTARATGAYLTLDEGLKTRRVTVKEAADGGDVNTLYVSNAGRKPLYVMAGEVVLGGRQDRCMGKDTLIPPGSRHVPVPVFCVEHGRWEGEGTFARSAGMAAGTTIRASAEDGAFAVGGVTRAYSTSGSHAPMAVAAAPLPVSDAQQQVWDKVARKNAHFQARPASGTYRSVLTLAAGGAQATVTPYLKALGSSLGSDPHLAGVVAAVNGRVVAADTFGDPSLFRRLWPKLLRSYAADAAENAPARNSVTPTVTPQQARLFFTRASDARQETQNKTNLATTLRLETPDTLDYRLVPNVAGRPKAAAPTLHENVLRK
jgi:hypothetical protein